jgi:hypothetical protein
MQVNKTLSKSIRLSDGLSFLGEEGTEFQQLFTGAYCLSRHGENDLFHPLKLPLFPKSVLPPCFCARKLCTSYDVLANFYQTTRCHFPGDCQRYENISVMPSNTPHITENWFGFVLS